MLKMSLTQTSGTEKSMNLVDEFGGGDRAENEARTSVSTKGPTGADYPSFNHVSHAIRNFVSNSAKNVSNTQSQTLKALLTNYLKPLLKRLSFNNLIRNNISGLKLTRLGILLMECWVSWLMTWGNGIQWLTSYIKWFLPKLDTKLTTVSFWQLLRPS